MLGDRVDAMYEDGIDMPDIVILPVYAALPPAQQQQGMDMSRKIYKHSTRSLWTEPF